MLYIKMQYISHYQYNISSTQNKKRTVNTENIKQDNSLQSLINNLNTSNKKQKMVNYYTTCCFNCYYKKPN